MAADHSSAGKTLVVPPCLDFLRPFTADPATASAPEKTTPGDIAGEDVHGGIFIRRNAVSAEYVVAGMPLCGEPGDHLCDELAHGKKYFEHVVPEVGFQFFEFRGRRGTCHVAEKTIVRGP